ncbi:GerMN domain-containing protein [Kribbella sp. CA-293567]|uniref:GerMN domain-containing protein n=1 Tax=Kribbella sp. CA-293567 TaxID=3002436 RepID=UPI0022DE2D7F|nr:GerMN domain-containing protein [Kribbella sp. CA-293567]WBQ02080.1 GerMN domain-containing protein [Kribbella sp. CA-293567]
MRAGSCLLAVLVLLTGCGVPMQDQASPIEPEAVPSRLGTPGNSPSATTTAPPAQLLVPIYFVREDRLVSLTREAPSPALTDQLNTVVLNLLAGPTDNEQAAGLSSAIPAGLQLSVVEVQGKRAVLELTGETDGRSATDNVLAVGQIVLSFTTLRAIDEIVFWRDGVPVETLLADGALTTKPLTAKDYAPLQTG